MRTVRIRKATSLKPQARPGAALIIAIVAIAVMTGLAHSLSLTVVRRQQQVERATQRAHARWLANSALMRARLLRNRDAAWSGETWNPSLPASAFQPDQKATVVIAVTPTDTSADVRLSVEAELAFGTNRTSRVRRSVTITGESSTPRQEKLP
jgi:type II secretory pathway pseudopilin PulG